METTKFTLTESIPPDIMHVLQEGVIQYEVKLVLKECICVKQLFTIRDLNAEFEHYFAQFRTDSMQRPNEITLAMLNSNDNKLKQSSERTMVLLRALPFVLSSLMPKTSRLYKFICELLNISNMVFSPCTTKSSLAILSEKTCEHLKEFKKLFPKKNVIPKQHYMLHLESNTLKLGPCTRFSAIRFEGKHLKPKKKVAARQNYKNLSKSVAKGMQREECSAAEVEEAHQHPLFANDLKPGKMVCFPRRN